MEFRHLGRSGLKISEITYGNWITHGGQVEADAATACVRAALDAGITTFDTADVYAGGRAEQMLGEALAGEQRSSIEIFSKVYFPVGDGPNDRGLSRKHVLESIDGSLRRLGTDHLDLYQAHRYDHSTPLEETMQAFADVVRSGKALYIGVSEWRAEELRAAKALAEELKVPLVSNQPQYSALYRVPEAEVLATVFVALPFVVNEVVPVLAEAGTDAEDAAATLGAGAWQTFRRITVPAIRWGITYGVVLATARALGEYGAIAIVSGSVLGVTQTLPLYVEDRFVALDLTGAFAAGLFLGLVAVAVLLGMTRLGRRLDRSHSSEEAR